jgi:rod shape-determining protein MreB
MAAAIGAGIPIQDPEGSMIVDIGGGTTEVAVLSLGDMVVAKSLGIAGDEMDEAIIQYFRRKYNLIIGDNTAEEVKMTIGSVFPVEEDEYMSIDVKGRDQITGLPKTVKVNSEEMRIALSDPAKAIIEVIKNTLEETPPELAADLVDCGIILSGGGSLVRGLDKLLSQETGLPVNRAEDPLTCVARGTGIYMEELDNMNKKSIKSVR